MGCRLSNTDSYRKGSTVQPRAVLTHAGNGTQNALGTQGKESTRHAAGELVAAFELASRVGSSTFPHFS